MAIDTQAARPPTHLVDTLPEKILHFPDFPAAPEEIDSATEISEEKPLAPIINISDLHLTTLPSTNGLRGIMSSFGPGLIRKPSLWATVEDISGMGMQSVLVTPNGATLIIKSKGAVQKAIDVYLEYMIGVEGLKVVLTLMDTWYKQTQASSHRATATISLRQFLREMGYDHKQFDSENERRKAYYCILYLTHLAATAKETRYVPENAKKPQGKKIRTVKAIEWKPLFTLRSPVVEKNGLPVIPETFTYSIGESFFAEMFGEEKHFFQLPTVEALRYNAKNEAHELCLLFYLSNMIIVSHASFIAHLLTLIFHAGLHREQDFMQDKNHLRLLDRVLMALEHLEIDGWIKREAQSLIDEILAIDLYSQICKPNDLAGTTNSRIAETYAFLSVKTAKELKSRKTALLKQLAEGSQAQDRIELIGGPLLETQAKKIKRSRAVAVAKQQRAVEASMKWAAKNA